MAKRQKKTTRFEYEELCAFVESNRVLLHGKPKRLEAQNIKKVWQTFADKINSLAIGPMKSADQWKKIFVEWKVNVKRKSRLIHEETTSTEGRPRITKPLSDLEERLLRLISKAHLGDSRLPDSLGHEEAVVKVEDHIIEFEESQLVDLSPREQSSDDAFLTPTPCTVEETPSETSQGDKRSRPDRYTNVILENACNSFQNANDASLKSNEMLAEALNKFTEVFQVKAEADMLRAKAEMAKAKCMHFQTFGNLDDFSYL